MLRLASSTVFPNALRAIASPRILFGSISAFSNSHDSLIKESPNCFSHHFSTESKKQLLDRKLVKILKTEIKSKQLSPEQTMPEVPADFPFTIQDNAYETTLTLTRELDGEKIEVSVFMVGIKPEDDEEESDFSDTDMSDDDTDDNGEGGGDDDGSSSTDSDSVEENETSRADAAPSLKLVVNISKENGKKLQIGVSASADEIKMNSMSVKETAAAESDGIGWYPVNIDSELQFAFKDFLEIRGVKKSYFGFMYDYMVRKSKQHPILALKELKKFVKE